MNKTALIIATTLLITGMTPAFAADWMTDMQTAISRGNLSEIDVIAANNPTAQGGIATYLLTQAQNNVTTHPDLAIKLFVAAAPFAGQIPLGDSRNAGNVIFTMLSLASDTSFQKRNAKGASSIFTAALAMSSESNLIVANPNLHNLALADAGDFVSDNKDPNLQDEVNLALQVGSPPPIGGHPVINPSPE